MSDPQNPYYFPVAYSAPRSASSDPVRWPAELRTALLVAAFSTLLGSVVGVLWHALAPQIDIVGIGAGHVTGSGFKPMIGDDVWLGLIGVVAGIVCVAAVIVSSPDDSRGPGATVGLAVGGLLGMLVAARVGHLIGHASFESALRAAYPRLPHSRLTSFLSYYDFSLRAKSALFTWPFVAVGLNTLILGMRSGNQPTPFVVSAYPGSS